MPHRVNEEDFIPPRRHRTFTRYIVLSDGETFDVLDSCTEIDVPDDIVDVDGYIRNRIGNNDHPTFDWRNKDKTD